MQHVLADYGEYRRELSLADPVKIWVGHYLDEQLLASLVGWPMTGETLFVLLLPFAFSDRADEAVIIFEVDASLALIQVRKEDSGIRRATWITETSISDDGTIHFAEPAKHSFNVPDLDKVLDGLIQQRLNGQLYDFDEAVLATLRYESSGCWCKQVHKDIFEEFSHLVLARLGIPVLTEWLERRLS